MHEAAAQGFGVNGTDSCDLSVNAKGIPAHKPPMDPPMDVARVKATTEGKKDIYTVVRSETMRTGEQDVRRHEEAHRVYHTRRGFW